MPMIFFHNNFNHLAEVSKKLSLQAVYLSQNVYCKQISRKYISQNSRGKDDKIFSKSFITS
jgi:hypothetical protein